MRPMANSNRLSRPYDDFIPMPVLRAVKQRRHSPDGILHEVKKTMRAGRRVNVYPWKKMELGDFFFVPLEGRSKQGLKIAIYQGAARHDLEIAVVPWAMPDGSECFRVTVVIINVSVYKLKAAAKGITGIGFSDGRWRERKKRWEQNQRGRPAPRTPTPAPTKSKPRNLDNPFWADETEEA